MCIWKKDKIAMVIACSLFPVWCFKKRTVFGFGWSSFKFTQPECSALLKPHHEKSIQDTTMAILSVLPYGQSFPLKKLQVPAP